MYMAEMSHFTRGGLQRAGLGQPFPICLEEVVAVVARGHHGRWDWPVSCALHPQPRRDLEGERSAKVS